MSYDIDGARQLAQRLRQETADKRSWDYERWAALLQMAATHLDNACNVLAAPAPQAVPAEVVAWMHDQPGRVDVIHADVKRLLADQHAKGYSSPDYMHRPLGKVEHYTIPLYAAPAASAADAAREMSEQDAGLLNQAVEMLEQLAVDQRAKGNDSEAEGAACSAHAVLRLATAMLAADQAARGGSR